MHERLGIVAATTSAAIGGVTIASTRILVAVTDPLTLSVVRFAAAFMMLLGLSFLFRVRWPRREDWGAVVVLGFVAYFVFALLFAASMQYTTAARAGLAFSTAPLQTMLFAAAWRVERLNLMRSIGVLIAMAGVAAALLTGLGTAPEGAWRGDLIMLTAVACISIHNIAARSYIGRSDPLAFATAGTGVGVACLVVVSLFVGDFASFARFEMPEWIALAFVSVAGGAVMFLLWTFALGRTRPTAAAVSVTANPVTASIAGALVLAEPIGVNMLIGLAGVAIGIWIAARA